MSPGQHMPSPGPGPDPAPAPSPGGGPLGQPGRQRFRRTTDHNNLNPDNYRWVKSSGQMWRIRWSGILLTVAFTAFVSMFLFGIAAVWRPWAWYVVGVLALVWHCAWGIGDTLPDGVKCPVCGYRPSRRWRTGDCLPWHQRQDRLLKLDRCPICHRRALAAAAAAVGEVASATDP